MKGKIPKILSVALALVLVLSFSLVAAVPAAAIVAGPPTIDGVISTGEWDGTLWFDETLDNTFTNPASMPVQIYMTNDADNLYVALDIPDIYDMRAHPEVAEGGSDTFSMNIGVEGEARSYSRILQFNTTDRTGDPNWFVLDGYFAQWAVATSETNTTVWGPDVEYRPIPAGVQSKTIIDEAHRVQEIAIPLSDLGVAPGTAIRIGGCIRAAAYEDYNFHALYPVGLDWGDAETYAPYSAKVNNETTGLYYPSIQAAIDGASPNDTISVPAGTYEGFVLVDESVNLLGANAGNKGTDPRGDESIIAGQLTGNGLVKITASDVTLDGFTIDATGVLSGTTGCVWIPGGQTGVTIENNIIVFTGAEPADSWGGVINSGACEASVKNNLVSNFRLGVYLNPGAAWIISNNTIEDSVHCGIGIDSPGVTEVTGNTIIGGYVGLELFGRLSTAAISVNGNDITGSEGPGIWMTGDIAGTEIGSETDSEDSNTITGSGTYDIHACDATGPAHIWEYNVYDTILIENSTGIFVHVPEGDPAEATVSGEGSVGAPDADTTVGYNGAVECTITTESLGEAEVEEATFGAAGKYVDVKVDDPANVTGLEVRVYYTDEDIAGLDEASLIMYWYDGTSWRACSDTGVEPDDIPPWSGYIWAQIGSTTSPTLEQMTGTPFGPGGGLDLDKDFYKVGETITVIVGDDGANGDPIRFDEITVHAISGIDTTGIDVTLDETDVNTGIFTGSFTTTTVLPPPSDVLGVEDGAVDSVDVAYDGFSDTASVDDSPPTITDLVPVDEAIVTDATPAISAVLADDGSGIDTETAVMTVGGEPVVATVTESSVTYTPSVDLSQGEHSVTVDVSDVAGNPSTITWSFSVDTVKPTVVGIGLAPDPPYTAEGPITFTLTFDEDMDTSVGPTVTFGLNDPFDTHGVTGAWAEESLTEWVGTFDIDETWDGDGEQTLKVSGAKDKATNEMEADISTTFTIDLNAPGAPTLTSPTDGATIEETAKPTFTWEEVTDASGVTYQLQVDDNVDFSSPELDVSDLETTTYTLTEALDNAEYSWRVRAIDGVGNNGEWSVVRTFTLNADTIDPEVTLISPNGGEVWQGGSEETISWTAEDNITPLNELSFTLLLSRGGPYDVDICSDLTAGDAAITLDAGVFSYTWTVPNYNNDHCRIQIQAVDLQENDAFDVSDTYFTITTPATLEIDLAAGWNLISLSVIPDDPAIGTILDSVAVDVVWGYDPVNSPDDPWAMYVPGVIEDDLTDMVDGMGYWVYMSDSATLAISGIEMPEPPTAPPAYDVAAGWNLMGVKAIAPIEYTDYLTSIEGDYSVIWGYNPETGYFNIHPLDTGAELSPGQGCWLWMKVAGIIVPPR